MSAELEAQALQALRGVLDPEVGVNIVDLGLLYSLHESPGGLMLTMTMTSAACPMADQILDEVEAVLAPLLGASQTLDIELVFDPPWTPQRMSPLARAILGWTGA
ncbi:metal-sulfur cluster biosynthetic enzyme [Inhella inkyongensis]|uniref:Metal-sulfur cluster biosynthetic enzyme n=1 Tax=Inhella inkyongensis TaxID=392593 RepID=A0A840S5N3_9BURK|nr:metal-sulfur cluster assembly factor [Inhella inkyongensis]MBB5205013.1 metal-sulfur cluster biosynthetic enzyme [Inhella inkyongensis]